MDNPRSKLITARMALTHTTGLPNLDGRKTDIKFLFDPGAEAMLKPQVDVARNVKWGLGWGLQETVPNYSFWHWGSMAGFRHYVVAYPRERIGVIVMTNSSKAFKIVDDVMSKAIGGGYPVYDWF